MTADVELDGLTVRFGAFTAVESANLRIKGGEFFSFLGPSGCGKTTILRAISGFIDPTEGAVRIGGRDMRGVALVGWWLALRRCVRVGSSMPWRWCRGVIRAFGRIELCVVWACAIVRVRVLGVGMSGWRD